MTKTILKDKVSKVIVYEHYIIVHEAQFELEQNYGMLIGLNGESNNMPVVFSKRELSIVQVRKKSVIRKSLTPSCPVTINNIFLLQSTEPATQCCWHQSHTEGLCLWREHMEFPESFSTSA